jgi:hypothetical protein
MISQYSNKKHHLSLNKPDVDIRNVGHIDPFFKDTWYTKPFTFFNYQVFIDKWITSFWDIIINIKLYWEREQKSGQYLNEWLIVV